MHKRLDTFFFTPIFLLTTQFRAAFLTPTSGIAR
jgi:hypothetical protein